MATFLETDEDILEVLNQRSEVDQDRECAEEEDLVEYEEVSDAYDSDEDPEYIPNEDDLLELESNAIDYVREIEQQEQEIVTQPTKKMKPTKNTVKKGRAKISSNEAVENEDERICKIDGEGGMVIGNNGFIWGTDCDSERGKTPGKNIIHIRPGPTANARQASSPMECFKLFLSANIVERVLQHTNYEISSQKRNYAVRDATVKELCEEELYALFGLIILAAALKDNHLNSTLMFDNTYCGDRYKATMSERRFKFLINCLRFDEKATRELRKETDKAAAISEIWNMLLENCRNLYKPGSYLAIDEQLVGFRGRCPFRMYIPSKPNKYGLKIVMMSDNATKYMVDARLYLGKGTSPDGTPVADYFVCELAKSIENSNRNVTMDNWFTSVPLVRKLSQEKGLTVVGTIKKDKAEFTTEFTDIKHKDRKVGSSLFLFGSDICAVSYKANKSKLVCLLSSMHDNAAISDCGKPEMVMVYNATKGAVDTFDQMCQSMNCNRKTQRWPLCLFYNMMNISAVNAYVVYIHNFIKMNGYNSKPLSRQQFMLELHKEMTTSWQQTRLDQGRVGGELKKTISKVLGSTQVQEAAYQKGARKYCSFCSYQKKRMTTTYCRCGAAICGEHQTKVCPNCA